MEIKHLFSILPNPVTGPRRGALGIHLLLFPPEPTDAMDDKVGAKQIEQERRGRVTGPKAL